MQGADQCGERGHVHVVAAGVHGPGGSGPRHAGRLGDGQRVEFGADTHRWTRPPDPQHGPSAGRHPLGGGPTREGVQQLVQGGLFVAGQAGPGVQFPAQPFRGRQFPVHRVAQRPERFQWEHEGHRSSSDTAMARFTVRSERYRIFRWG